MSLDSEVALFIAAEAAILFPALMVLRPYRAGRKPLAIYDQLCVYAIAVGVGFAVAGQHGATLWIVGMAATLCGVIAGFALELLPIRAKASRQFATFYALSGLACFASALLGGRLGETLLPLVRAS